MAVQTAYSYTNYPFVRGGNPTAIDTQTLLQDAGRGAVDLEILTVMARVSTGQKLVPLTDIAAVDGTNTPVGFMLSTVLAADIVAGDVTGLSIMNGGDRVVVTEDQIVLENSLTLATVVTATGKTIREHLNELNIYPQATFDADELQS